MTTARAAITLVKSHSGERCREEEEGIEEEEERGVDAGFAGACAVHLAGADMARVGMEKWRHNSHHSSMNVNTNTSPSFVPFTTSHVTISFRCATSFCSASVIASRSVGGFVHSMSCLAMATS